MLAGAMRGMRGREPVQAWFDVRRDSVWFGLCVVRCTNANRYDGSASDGAAAAFVERSVRASAGAVRDENQRLSSQRGFGTGGSSFRSGGVWGS